MFYGKDGIKWEINYKMGIKNGPGTIIFEDNSMIECIWEDDNLKKDIKFLNKQKT